MAGGTYRLGPDWYSYERVTTEASRFAGWLICRPFDGEAWRND